MNDRIRIIGIGSDFGDDRVGSVVIEQLVVALPGVDARFVRSPLDLVHGLEDVQQLHVVDACHGAGTPGTILRRAWPLPVPSSVRFGGTHDVDLITALDLAERLQMLPQRVTIWGIETTNRTDGCDFRAPLTPPVAAAMTFLVSQIVEAVQAGGVFPAEVNGHA